ncbi:MAG: bifunctional riboflavin kinase/FAD synthetase [Sedimentisphaerales bacterium]|nr:bifunctional riboflavin kinase/FAD synthetase [Sedimentisphaerales bacterium]
MQTISNISQLKMIEKGSVLTIGNFDGVHIGHQRILAAGKQAAAEKGVKLLVMTFQPHPLAIVRPDKAPAILTPLSLKERLIDRFGADYLFVVESSPELLSLSAQEFTLRFLVDSIKPSLVVEGQSFNFGSDRSGSIETLHLLGKANGFDVSEVKAEPVPISAGRSITVSSTIIRQLLAEGNVADAAIALARPYRLIEKVISGRGKGRRLGFPTANLNPPNQAVPAHGVYAGFVQIADSQHQLLLAKAAIPAAISIGLSATYGDVETLLIEAHLLAGDIGDLYGKHLAMDFIRRIRSQQKFTSESDLAKQIAKDCEKAQGILATNM